MLEVLTKKPASVFTPPVTSESWDFASTVLNRFEESALYNFSTDKGKNAHLTTNGEVGGELTITGDCGIFKSASDVVRGKELGVAVTIVNT